MFFFCNARPTEEADAETVAAGVYADVSDDLESFRTAGSHAPTHGVRTTADKPVDPQAALEMLRAGNERFVSGATSKGKTEDSWRQALSHHGQRPMATVIGCADSRCPVEILFDAKPGDIFVLRNAGNTCTHSEGSMVGSVEYSVQHLHTNLVLVLGHTKCGAIAGATKCMLENKRGNSTQPSSVLDVLLADLVPVAAQAETELLGEPSLEMIAAHAVKVNIFHTMERLFEYSDVLRQKMQAGEVQVQGAIYNLDTGAVEFLGKSPREKLLLGSQSTLASRDRALLSADGKKGPESIATTAASEKAGSDNSRPSSA